MNQVEKFFVIFIEFIKNECHFIMIDKKCRVTFDSMILLNLNR